MPLVHGVHMRWSLRKDPCFVCKKVEHEKFMIEVEHSVMLCPECVELFKKRCRDGKGTVSWGPLVDGARSTPM